MQKEWIIIGVVMLLVIPIASAPVWYGSGDDTGLVGRWSCEGNFKDSSGQGNNGTQIGGVKITSGAKGRACSFDGVNDYVNVTSASALNAANLTISAWVKVNAFSGGAGGGGIVTKRIWSNTDGYMLYLRSTRMDLSYSNASDYTWTDFTYNAAFNTNKWYHLAATVNRTDVVFYINGQEVQRNVSIGTVTNGLYPTEPLRIGVGYSLNHYFNGTIDEVRIYNRSLSATEVNALYDTGKTYKFEMLGAVEKGGLNDTPAPTITDETGLVGYWKMDDLTNGNTTDSSGQGNSGSVIGATFNSGRWDKGYNFDGSDDYINAGNSTSLNTTATALTVSFWAKADTISAWDAPIGKTHDANWYGWGFSTLTTTDTMNFFVAGGYVDSSQFANISFKSGEQSQWHHWVGTYDGAAVNIYKDGVAGISGAKTGVSAGVDDIVEIGSNKRAGTSQNWDGLIDEVRIYNRSLSAAEVKELYLSKGLVGYWKMDADQKNSTHTYDSSGYNNHGIITGATLTNEGRFKEAYKFDGATDLITIDYDPTLKLNQSGGTVSLWVKPSSLVAGTHLLASYGGPQYGNGWLLSQSGSSLIFYWLSSGGTITLTNIFTVGQWTHVTMTKNITSVSAYINGVFQSSANPGTNTEGNLSTLIGAQVGGGWDFNGTIDEVRVYNRALTSDEILGLYQGTKTNKVELLGDPTLGGLNETPLPTISNETGLVGWWKMEDLTNGNTTDSSGQGNNGVINGAALNSSGRWSSGYSFDGVNDFINISTFSNPTDTMTASAWIKTTGVTSSGGYGGIVGNTYTNFRLCRDKDRGVGKEYSFEWDNQWNVGLGIPATMVEDGKWHSLIGVYNGTHIINYLDGNEYDKYAYVGTISALTGIMIGRSYYSLTNCCYFNGTIDEVRIYNRALSPSEVKELYLSKGLVGYWRMDADQKNSTSTFDSSGYYNHGLITGAVQTNEGRFKEGYKFDGVDDYIYTANWTRPENVTISAWIKTNTIADAASDDRTIFGWSNSAWNTYTMLTRQLGKIRYGWSSAANNYRIYQTASVINPGAWYHVAVTQVSNSSPTIYVNGAGISSSLAQTLGSDALPSNSLPSAIGNPGTSTYAVGRWNGTIDEVRVYNRALTADEVLGLYQGTKTNEFAWWSVTG